MPSFTCDIANLVTAGPVVEVFIGPTKALVDAMRTRKMPAPSPSRVMAMIDTGASCTVISPSVAGIMGLQPVDVARMSTPSTQQPMVANLYNVSIEFPNRVVASDVLAVEAPLVGQPIQCLIGRDILSQGVLVYIGYTNQFTLSF